MKADFTTNKSNKTAFRAPSSRDDVPSPVNITAPIEAEMYNAFTDEGKTPFVGCVTGK